MIRSELVLRVAEMNPHLYAKDVEATVDAILDRVEEALTQGDRVELRGFGAFSVLQREPGTKLNPRTGTTVAVGERVAIRFKPSKGMQERLNHEEAAETDEAERFLRGSCP